ncbi:MAG: hypothetical protein ACUVRE_07790 [Thermoanaerobaculaceae bacterium]
MGLRLAQFLALIALVVGLRELYSWRQGTQQPKWVRSLDPIRFCPLPQGQEVWVLLPPHLPSTQADWVLMELFWQQENVRWRLVRGTEKPRRFVLLAPGVALPGVKPICQREGWTLGWAGR